MPLAHTDRAYETELKDLREKLLSMGGKVEVAISRCVRSVTERDSQLACKQPPSRWRIAGSKPHQPITDV